jgi:hypothetical protein
MPSARYRLFDFGTLYLTQEQRQSTYLVMVVEVLNFRLPPSESGKRLPPQGVWAYVTQRWQDAVQGREVEVRFRKSKFVLWELDPIAVAIDQCARTNILYADILAELAKKPNIPPLPPSIPPVLPLESLVPRTLLLRPGALSIKSVYQSDMDVSLYWSAAPDDGSGACKPLPVPDPPQPPIAPSLPTPSGAWAGPQFPLPASLPAGSPPIGGGSLNQPGAFSGDQSIPPTTFTQSFLRMQVTLSGSPPACVAPPVQVIEFGPFPGLLSSGSLTFQFASNSGNPAGSCGGTGYIYNISGPAGPILTGYSYVGTAPPVSLQPRYA